MRSSRLWGLVFSLCLTLSFGIAAGVIFPGSFIHWHVPAAIMTYLAFVVCVVMNILRALGRSVALSHPLCACDVGLVFAGITLVAGMIWGRHAWGTAWIWEPRLTGMLLMTLIFLSWRMTASHIAKHVVAERVATSSLILLGLPSMAFTHLATRLLGGIHPHAMPEAGHPSALPVHAFVLTGSCYVALAILIILVHRFRRPSTPSQKTDT